MGHGSSINHTPVPLPLSEHEIATVSYYGDRDQPLTLWLPGCSGTPDDYGDILTVMAEMAPDRCFVSPWWPGEEDSSGLAPHESYTDRFIRIFDALNIPDMSEAVIAGHSAGGRLAAQVASRQENTRAVSIASPGEQWPNSIELGRNLWIAKLNHIGSIALLGSVVSDIMHTPTLIAINKELEGFSSAELKTLRDMNRWITAYGNDDKAVSPTAEDIEANGFIRIPGNHYTTVLTLQSQPREIYKLANIQCGITILGLMGVTVDERIYRPILAA